MDVVDFTVHLREDFQQAIGTPWDPKKDGRRQLSSPPEVRGRLPPPPRAPGDKMSPILWMKKFVSKYTLECGDKIFTI